MQFGRRCGSSSQRPLDAVERFIEDLAAGAAHQGGAELRHAFQGLFLGEADLGAAVALAQADLHPQGLQVPFERRSLQLLLPDVALRLGRADAAEVGADAPTLGRLQHLRPLRPLAARLAVDVLDPRRPRPPARQRVGIGDELPGLAARRLDGARAADAGHSVAGKPAQVPDQQQVLEVADRRRQAFQALQRLFAPLGVARAQRRPQQRFQQVRLAVGRGAEDAQVPGADTHPRELVGGADDLAVGLVVDGLALAFLRLHDPVVLELADQLLAGAGLLDYLLQRQVGARGVDEDRPPHRAAAGFALAVAAEDQVAAGG